MVNERGSGPNQSRGGGDLSRISAGLKLHWVKRECIDCGREFEAIAELNRWRCGQCGSIWAAREEEDRRAREAALVEARFREVIAAAKLPRRWRDVTFATSDPALQGDAFRVARSYAEHFRQDSESLVFYSRGYGTGKTHLAICIANHVLHHLRRPVLFQRARDLMLELRRTFSDRGDLTEADVLDQVLSAELLVLDDVGVDPPSQWLESTYMTVFGRRLDWQLPVVVTTNHPLEPQGNEVGLGDRIGYGALSRLVELCAGTVVELKGTDLR